MEDTIKRKDHAMLLRLDADERRMLLEVAAKWGVTLSSAIRRLIREAK
jgi:hypothetical protein